MLCTSTCTVEQLSLHLNGRWSGNKFRQIPAYQYPILIAGSICIQQKGKLL